MKQKQQKKLRGLGVSALGQHTYLFVHDTQSLQNVFIVRKSSNGIDFVTISSVAIILDAGAHSDDLVDCSDFRLSQNGDFYYLTYTLRKDGEQYACVARSRNLVDWEKIFAQEATGNGQIVAQYTFHERQIMYRGGNSLQLYASPDGQKWRKKTLRKQIVARGRADMHIVDTRVAEEGIWVVYYIAKEDRRKHAIQYQLYTVLFDAQDPSRILWRAQQPLYVITGEHIDNAHVFGFAIYEEYFLSYWQQDGDGLFLLRHTLAIADDADEVDDIEENVPQPVHDFAPVTCVARVPQNPIMSPQQSYIWESKYVFNPAAICLDGVVHILYRAIGHHDVSVLGYAATEDGIHITRRLPFPAYIPRKDFEGAVAHPQQGQSDVYASGGGGWGGCEDPKLTRIGNKIYLVYVAYNGWGPPRLAMSWISVDDFLAHRWNWSEPILISRPNEVNKSGCILPEKINGKYVIFHRVFPNILIDFVDDLDFDGESRWLEGQYKIPPRKGMWDAGKLSVASPPMRTKDGWLMIYHAVTGRPEWEGSDLRYKIGAMLLDINDPTKVLYRTNQPLLEPETHYENDGAKYGIVYPCGAVIKDDTLFIYYGGSDEFVCVATAPIDQFLRELKETGSVQMTTDE